MSTRVRTITKTSSIEPPKPGANAFHYFNYSEKIRLGSKYDYQKTLKKWKDMSDASKSVFKQHAESRPKHKKLPGAGRSVSAYDVLRRMLKKHDFEPEDDSNMNRNEYTVAMRRWIVKNYETEWQNWLTTPETKQMVIVRKAHRAISN